MFFDLFILRIYIRMPDFMWYGNVDIDRYSLIILHVLRIVSVTRWLIQYSAIYNSENLHMQVKLKFAKLSSKFF